MTNIASLIFTLFFFNHFSYAIPFDEELGLYEASQMETPLSISHHNATKNESLNKNNIDVNSSNGEQKTNNKSEKLDGKDEGLGFYEAPQLENSVQRVFSSPYHNITENESLNKNNIDVNSSDDEQEKNNKSEKLDEKDEGLGFYEAPQLENSVQRDLPNPYYNITEYESLINNNSNVNINISKDNKGNNSQKQIYLSEDNETNTIIIFLILLIGFVLILLIISCLPIKPKEQHLEEPSRKKNTRPLTTEKLEKSHSTELPNKPKAKSATIENGLTQQKSWRIFHCSIQGKDHLKADPAIPCQDNHYIHPIDEDWGVAVVCDGAGSHKYSHIGSKFVSKFIATRFAEMVKDSKAYREKTLPEDNLWREVCKGVMCAAYQSLDCWVKQQLLKFDDIKIDNTGCTVIVTIYSPYGLLVAHIGDGRAGYRDEEGWQSMMIPFKGEYVNQTVFLNTQQIYANQFENLLEPNNPYLETRVIRKKVSAFVLMSDGCEAGLYNTIQYDEEKQQNVHINRPINGLDSVIQNLMEKEEEEAKIYFEQIIREGNPPLKKEGDDKTLVLAIFN